MEKSAERSGVLSAPQAWSRYSKLQYSALDLIRKEEVVPGKINRMITPSMFIASQNGLRKPMIDSFGVFGNNA
jgi:hypothetical protein